MSVYTVGDSHCWHGWLHVPGVEFSLIGPMTMHSFGQGQPIITRGIPTDATIIYCWGEIDCRCHVHKHLPYKECIDGLVARYVEGIKKNQQTHPKAIIYNVVPPPRREKTAGENPAFPFLGTNEERLSYVTYMNQKLKETGYPFIDIYSKVSDSEGYLEMSKSDNHVHIADPQPLIEWLNQYKGAA